MNLVLPPHLHGPKERTQVIRFHKVPYGGGYFAHLEKLCNISKI